jgi:lipid A 3-O-deacylase
MRRSLACCLVLAALPLSAARPAVAEERPVTPFLELGPVTLHGSESDLLMLGLGAFDPFDNGSAAAATLEYRFGRKLFFVGPALGGMANSDGGLFGYFGLYFDLSAGPVYFTGQLATGAYHQGDSRDLGGVFQFRESIDLAYRFDNGHRLGARVAHISNADIHDRNPGEEEYYLTYAIALGPLF